MPGARILALAVTLSLAGCALEAEHDDPRVAAQALGAPGTSTTGATSVTNASATLNGSANPGGLATTGWFRYDTTNPGGSCDDTFGTRVPASGGTDLGSGSGAVAYSQSIGGLAAGTTYYFCAIATNSDGRGFGQVLSFTTLAPPAVTTLAAFAVTATGATLNGSANPRGDSAYGYFRYSGSDPGTCNDTFGTRVPASSASDSSLGAGSSAVSYSFAISGLTPATTYYSCAIARNAYGTSFGAVLSFTTPAAMPAVTTSSPTLVTGGAAQLNGTANPGGAPTTGWFRYSTVSPGSCNDTFGTRAPAVGGSSLGAGTTATSFSQAITGLSRGRRTTSAPSPRTRSEPRSARSPRSRRPPRRPSPPRPRRASRAPLRR